jgi:hypothetical protein
LVVGYGFFPDAAGRGVAGSMGPVGRTGIEPMAAAMGTDDEGTAEAEEDATVLGGPFFFVLGSSSPSNANAEVISAMGSRI